MSMRELETISRYKETLEQAYQTFEVMAFGNAKPDSEQTKQLRYAFLCGVAWVNALDRNHCDDVERAVKAIIG